MLKRLTGESVDIMVGMLLTVDGSLFSKCIVIDPGTTDTDAIRCRYVTNSCSSGEVTTTSIALDNISVVSSMLINTVDTPVHIALTGNIEKAVSEGKVLWRRKGSYRITKEMAPFITRDTVVYNKKIKDVSYVKQVLSSSSNPSIVVYKGGRTSRSTSGGDKDSYTVELQDVFLPEDEYNRINKIMWRKNNK